MLQPVHKSTRKPETSVTPNAPTLNTHTHTAQPQPDQNRADHGHATNPTDPTGLSASPGSSELTQVVCCNLQCLFTLSSVPPKCHLWEMLLLFFFALLRVSLSRVAFSKSGCYSCHVLLPARVCVHAFVSMCVHIRTSCGSDMGFGCDRRACKHAVCLCGAGCSSRADAQWFTSTLCVSVSMCRCTAA